MEAGHAPVLNLGASSFISQFVMVVSMAVQNNVLVRYGALSEYGAEIPMTALGVTMKIFSILIAVLIGLGSEAKDRCYVLAKELRALGVSVDFDLMDRSVKAQMKYADKTGALYTLVVGEEELKDGAANLKSMQNGGSILVKLEASAIADMIVKEG